MKVSGVRRERGQELQKAARCGEGAGCHAGTSRPARGAGKGYTDRAPGRPTGRLAPQLKKAPAVVVFEGVCEFGQIKDSKSYQESYKFWTWITFPGSTVINFLV